PSAGRPEKRARDAWRCHAAEVPRRVPSAFPVALLSTEPEQHALVPRVTWPLSRGRDRGDAHWNQVYDPFGNATRSTAAPALPVITLLVPIASNRVKAPIAIIALLVAIGVAAWALTMPPNLALRAAILGAVMASSRSAGSFSTCSSSAGSPCRRAHRRH